MEFSALVQLYGKAAQGAPGDAFAQSVLNQFSLSLYNRATSITENFQSIYSPEEFILAFMKQFRLEPQAILFRDERENFDLRELELIWRLCELKFNHLVSDSEKELSAILDVAMHMVAHQSNDGQKSPYLIVRTADKEKYFGVCLDRAQKCVELWELTLEKEVEFLKHVRGEG